ncbi:MAG: Para-hydroxybenzoate--polyprenyltransferase, mitochondrial precursor (PHB:polyprenyltransferase) [Chrysothrix sp. TS-e1954]|nr:MAG: Para-hydroxybenzoate--polyprenyltransferase, mitochondrial precursor (PHB:polyprenyltransferase) [Chrysothrix sp. TS-e1954]
MARGAITTREGYVFCAVQLILWLLVLSVTNPSTLLIALPIIGLATFYPFAKRITDYPQVVLAVTFSWGTLVGAAHLGVKVSEMRVDSSLGAGLMSLFLSYSLWTIIHDTVYAFQDLKDDAKIGAKSMAVKHQNKATRMLVVLSALNVLALFAVGFCINANMVYYIIACGAISIMLSTMVMRLDLMNPHECLWWFQNGSILYGTLNTIALIQEYSSRRL